MRVSAGFTGLVGAVAGGAVAVAAYLSGSSLPAPVADGSGAGYSPPAPTAPHVLTRSVSCEPPARLLHEACVNRVARTVVVYDAPGSSTATRRVVVGKAATSRTLTEPEGPEARHERADD